MTERHVTPIPKTFRPPKQPKRLGRGKGPTAKRRTVGVRAERDAIREAVFRRDSYECQARRLLDCDPCYGPLTPHHRLKAGQGGGYTLANLTSLCQHHNDQLEADADLAAEARRHGLVVKSYDPEARSLR